MNKSVLKWAPLPILIVLWAMLSLSHALAARPKAHNQPEAAVNETGKPPVPAATARPEPRAAYTSSEPGCLTTRKVLWTDAGWIVRRVTSCR